jgi:hypothetical protein
MVKLRVFCGRDKTLEEKGWKLFTFHRSVNTSKFKEQHILFKKEFLGNGFMKKPRLFEARCQR